MRRTERGDRRAWLFYPPHVGLDRVVLLLLLLFMAPTHTHTHAYRTPARRPIGTQVAYTPLPLLLLAMRLQVTLSLAEHIYPLQVYIYLPPPDLYDHVLDKPYLVISRVVWPNLSRNTLGWVCVCVCMFVR